MDAAAAPAAPAAGMSITVKKCRSCKAPIVWMRSKRGKNVPVDADSIDEAELEFDEEGHPQFVYGTHVAHFTTCPYADQHRQGRR